MGKIRTYQSISEFNDEFGVKTLHPLINVVDMSTAPKVDIRGAHCYDFYSVFLKDSDCGAIQYGRNTYDYQKGTLLFIAPLQVMEMESEKNVGREEPKGWALMFHRDLLRGTHLGQIMKNFTYFSYDVNEALHLSEDERTIITGCLRNILIELQHAIDKNSKDLILSNLEVFFNYSKRFYERQFITRSQVNSDVLTRFEQILDDYFSQGVAKKNGIPNVKYMADKLHYSPNYLSDQLRETTGKSALEHIQLKLIEISKELLLSDTSSINEIAYQLGFEYPQYFSRLFKKKVGVTPNQYRLNRN